MITLQSIQLFAINIAIVSSLCFAIALGLSRVFASLPKRYATLAVGLVAGLLAPLMVALGTWGSLGLLPAMPSQPTVAMPIAIDMGAPTQAQLPRSSEIQPPLASESYAPASSPVPYSAKLVINRSADGIAIVNEASQAPQRPTWPMIIGTALLASWAAGSLLLLFGQVRKMILCRQFLNGCRLVNDAAVQKLFAHTKERLGINRDVQLLESDRLPTPVVIGCWRPRVLLPSEIQLTLSRGQLASVLTHELSHIRRKDHCMAMLQTIANLLYWWNPLCRFTSRRTSELREMICDDIATAEDVAPREYAQTIVQMAARTVATRELALSLGISLSPISELERRLKRIIADRNGNVDISISKRFTTALLAMSVLLISGLLFAQVPSNSPKQSNDTAPQNKAESLASANKLGKASNPPAEVAGHVVDTAGKPVANANVYLVSPVDEVNAQTKTDSEGKYRFDVRMHNIDMLLVKLWAKSSDETLQGYHHFEYQKNRVPLGNLQLKVEPVKVAKIQVVDAEGKPIPGANATVSLHAIQPIIVEAKRTDANGFASLSIPPSEKIERAIAWKDGSGLDFKTYILPSQEQRTDFPFNPSEFPFATQETLRLDGAQPFSVRVVDDQNQPRSDVSVVLGKLQKDGGRQSLDLTNYYDLIDTKTATDGTASFAWFPAWQYDSFDINSHAVGLALKRTPKVLRPQSGHIEIAMQRTVPIRGRVMFADGKPAPGITVRAMGRAKIQTDNYGWVARTDSDGRYEMPVAPHQVYLLVVQDNEWSSRVQTDIPIQNQGVDNRDFVLSATSRLHGKIVDVSNGAGIPGVQLTLTRFEKDPVVLLEPVTSPNAARDLPFPLTSDVTLTDKNGDYEFSAGDGFYLLGPVGKIEAQNPVRVLLEGERDKDVNFTVKVVGEAELSGSVVSAETGQPLSDVRVSGESRTYSIQDPWQMITDNNGQFKIRKKKTASAIVALNSDLTLGAVALIGRNQTNVELRLKKLGSAQGRLMNEDGTTPLAGRLLAISRHEPDETGRTVMLRQIGFVSTDEDGKFFFKQLVSGATYSISLADDRGDYVIQVAFAITVVPGETTQLGDIQSFKQEPQEQTSPAIAR